MNKGQIDELAAEAQRIANADPIAYERKVRQFVNLGYAFMVVSFLVCVGLIVLAVFLLSLSVNRISIGCGVVAISLSFGWIKPFLSRKDRIDGVQLSSAQRQGLTKHLERLTAAMDAPKIDKVYYDHELNAYAVLVPKFLMPWRKLHIVTVGLPLLLSMDEECVVALLAHELAHHSRKHTAFGQRVGALLNWWQRFGSESRMPIVQLATYKFYCWYYPRLKYFSAPLERMNEFEADRLAKEQAGSDACARLLVSLRICQTLRWNPHNAEINRWIAEHGNGRFPFYRDYLERGFATEPEPASLLTAALRIDTMPEDSHPCLRERLSALGVVIAPDDTDGITEWASKVMEIPKPSSAETMFGASYERIIDEAQAHVQISIERQVPSLLQKRDSYRNVLRQLESVMSVRELNESETRRYIITHAEVHGYDETFEIARTASERFPNSPAIALTIGHLLYGSRPADAKKHLEIALNGVEQRESALALLARIHRDEGDASAARDALFEAKASAVLKSQVDADFLNRNALGTAILWSLTEEERRELHMFLARMPFIHRAWAVERSSKLAPGETKKVLVMFHPKPFSEESKRKWDLTLQKAFEHYPLKSHNYYFMAVSSTDKIVKDLERLPSWVAYVKDGKRR